MNLCTKHSTFLNFLCTMPQEDETDNFDSLTAGLPTSPPGNSGYRQRKKQFAKEVEVKDGQGDVTGYKWASH